MNIIITSFILGISASLSCISICMPVLIPYLGCSNTGLRKGFTTSVVFTSGRFIIYIGLAFTVFALGSVWNEGKNIILSRTMQVLLSIGIILYGLGVGYKHHGNLSCLFKTSACNYSFTLIIGMLAGGILCPALWLVILQAVRTESLILILLSLTSFWLGSSLLVISTGSLTGRVFEYWKSDKEEKFRKVCGFTLVLVGFVYLFGTGRGG